MKKFFKKVAGKFSSKVCCSLLIACGIAMSGYFIYSGICRYAQKNRCVEVRGLSEREVLANRVTWPMSVSVRGASPDVACDEVTVKKDTLVKFLKDNGVSDECINISSVDVRDMVDYSVSSIDPKERYQASIDVTVNSDKVAEVVELMNRQSELLRHGVRVQTQDYNVEYDFVDLTSLKPEMVEEATKDARRVAMKFAKDADCDLGSIYQATQGQFSIESQYHRPQYKLIRVVTIISYYLK